MYVLISHQAFCINILRYNLEEILVAVLLEIIPEAVFLQQQKISITLLDNIKAVNPFTPIIPPTLSFSIP